MGCAVCFVNEYVLSYPYHSNAEMIVGSNAPCVLWASANAKERRAKLSSSSGCGPGVALICESRFPGINLEYF